MSYKNYLTAMKLASQCRYYLTANGRTPDEIKAAEDMLGVKFSRQCWDFYNKYGYLSFYGNEIFGINTFDDSGELEGNSVLYALNDRTEYRLPLEWIPIYNYGDGNMAYLDYGSLNADKEPRVIVAGYNGHGYTIVRIVAEDFGDFILDLVLTQLREE